MEAGFDPERFIKPVDEDFICPICHCVVRNPVIIQCEHMFCKNCITQCFESSDSCPVCKLAIASEASFRPPQRVLANILAKLDLTCSAGCGKVFKLETITRHEKECSQFISCPFEKCKQEVKLANIFDHVFNHSVNEKTLAITSLVGEVSRLKKELADQVSASAKEIAILTKTNEDLIARSCSMKAELEKIQELSSRIQEPHSVTTWHRWSYQRPTRPDVFLQKKFFDCVENGDVEGVKLIVATNKVFLDCPIPGNPKTSLQHACHKGDAKMVQVLLQCGADPDCPQTPGGITALHYAAGQGLSDVLDEMLTIFGSKAVNQVSDVNRETPLHWAARSGTTDAVKVLLNRGAEAGIRNRWNKTALDIAGEKQRESCILLEIAQSSY